jgi:hypothetical protein
MRRQLFVFMCAALLAASGAHAMAADAPGGGAPNPAAPKGAAAKTKTHRHPATPPKPAPDISDIDKSTTASGAIQAGQQSVRTDKTLNNNTMKILPP